MTPARPQRPSKNLLAGLMFVGFGALGLWLARDLDVGNASDMGPGYFPRAVCAMLIVLGGVLAAMSLLRPDESTERWTLRPLLLITLSALAFALLLKPLGLVGTLAVTTVLASVAGAMLRPLALAALAVALIAVNVGIFVVTLKMPIPLWPSVF